MARAILIGRGSFYVLKILLLEIRTYVSGHPVHSVRIQDIEGFLFFLKKKNPSYRLTQRDKLKLIKYYYKIILYC